MRQWCFLFLQLWAIGTHRPLERNWKKSKDELDRRRTNTAPALSPPLPPPKKKQEKHATWLIGKPQGKSVCAAFNLEQSPELYKFHFKTTPLASTMLAKAMQAFFMTFVSYKKNKHWQQRLRHTFNFRQISCVKESSLSKIKSQKSQRNSLWK